MAFFRSLFANDSGAAQPSVPSGYRVYAIGDIHGRLDLLDDTLARIEADNAGRAPARNMIVFLGDLIDRGPSSAQVIERARTYRPPGVRKVFISGNHEEVLLRLLRGESRFLQDWLRFGGAECARSYGISPTALKRMDPDQAVGILADKIPKQDQEFLASFVDTFRVGSYLFVHAGVRPGVPLPDQKQSDLRWIRQPFLDNDDDHGFIVVHGHTIANQIDVRGNRIGLDTGAYRTGVLTAMGLEGQERWFLQTEAKSSTGANSNQEPPLVASRDLGW
ncbi:metallophosphoesterase [Sphingomonas sp.]|uniref:metallophosphoesterase n=1 Tax=Sphingomonas sp. TaxID=28214 RepID=UPI0017CCB8FE|nr:metallophosphoesterase [Sphingomonas sp.]MBA3512353.1 serine/threonine protein phosphatase [Sphingomonas sp.]